MTLSGQLQEAMDVTDDVAHWERVKAEKRAEEKRLQKEAQDASTISGMLFDVRAAGFRGERSPQEAWAWAFRGKNPKGVRWFQKNTKWTASAIEAGAFPTEEEVEAARAEWKRLDGLWRAAYKEWQEADKGLKHAKKAPQRKQKQLAQQDHGVCQVCFKRFVVQGLGVVRHGWKESGGRRKGSYGMVYHGRECEGSGAKPFQADKKVCEAYTRGLKETRDLLEKNLNVSSWDELPRDLKLIVPKPKNERVSIGDIIEQVYKSYEMAVPHYEHALKTWRRDDEWIARTRYRG